jgi:hypothetical protein
MLRATLLLCLLFGLGCSAALGEDCRSHPNSCVSGSFCCTSNACGGGMCTFSCASDRDCPSAGYCSGGNCFPFCKTDRDCAPFLQCLPRDGKLMCRGD